MEKGILNYITLKLTNRCNLNCYMCGQNYAHMRQDNADLDLELIKKRITAEDGIKTVYLFGGEPFLYKDLIPLLILLREKEVNVLISSNGMLLDRFVPAVITHKVRDLDISVDSHRPDVFHKIRGGDLNLVINNIKYLLEQKKIRKSVFPHTGVNIVILPDNYANLLDIYHFIDKELPEIERISFAAPIITTGELGNSNTLIFKQYLNCDTISWKWFYNIVPQFTLNQLETIYDQIKVLQSYPKVTFQAPTTHKGILDAFTNAYSLPEKICFYPFSVLVILPNGDVTFCADFPDYIIGNIGNSPLAELWNSARAQSFRYLLLKNGSYPICARCPHRYDIDEFYIN